MAKFGVETVESGGSGKVGLNDNFGLDSGEGTKVADRSITVFCFEKFEIESVLARLIFLVIFEIDCCFCSVFCFANL